jgi:membrane protein
MAYYAFFSLAPLLILAIALAGAFFGIEAAEGKIVTELQHFIGRDGA